MAISIQVNEKRIKGRRSPMLYGHSSSIFTDRFITEYTIRRILYPMKTDCAAIFYQPCGK